MVQTDLDPEVSVRPRSLPSAPVYDPRRNTFMIPLHTHPSLRRSTDAQSDMSDSVASTTALAVARKPPSIHSAAKARVYKWSRRIMITTESLWLKKIRRNKFKAFVYIALPSMFIFLLAFSLAPPKGYSNSNNLLFYMGGIMQPDMMFTSGILPKRINSARDSFDVRYTPLLAALGYGATSVEIFLWLQDGVLYAGAKAPGAQTLDQLYLSKLRMMLGNVNQNIGNPGNPISPGGPGNPGNPGNPENPGNPGNPNGSPGGRPCGVFQSAPYLPLQLVMNIQSDGPSTYAALDAALQPFLQSGWLTTVNTTNPQAPPKQSALTIIVNGNVQIPTSLDSPNPLRYIFYDAPLKELGENPIYTPALSPMASASFSSIVGARWIVPKLAKEKIVEYVVKAHARGIAVRITNPIDFPAWVRNMYWQMLLDCGVDWLDVDDLVSAGQF